MRADPPRARSWPRTVPRRLSPVLLAAVLCGCEGIQSALAPKGVDAREIMTLGWLMIGGSAVIFVGVMALMVCAVFASRGRARRLDARTLIVGGGIVFPVVVLSGLLVYVLVLMGRLTGPAGPEAIRIEVVGHQFWWEVRYLDEAGDALLVTANEVVIPVGRPIEFLLSSSDVIHSFWVPSLAGKVDMIPGHTNRLTLTAEEPGVYRAQCAEYCGLQHTLMALYVVAEPPEAFEAWRAGQQAPAPEPATPFLAVGRDAFLAAGCGACHAVRGTPADGRIGPDLTHVGSRLSIAAGVLPNNVGTLAGWIADAQHLKPGNRMPSFNELDGETLRAMAAYLESLE